MEAKQFHGVVVPLVTPFTAAGEVDEAGVGRLLDHLCAGGVAGVLLLGTTGEDASLCPADRLRLVRAAAGHARGRLTLYAGISANCVAQSVEAAEAYLRAGVDALVARLPTYYALSPQEQHDYFRLLLSRIRGPLLLYNIPITTHMSMPLDVVEALSTDPQVAGIKDSESDLPRFQELLLRLGGRPGFSIFCGAGAYFAQALAAGADGFVPTAGNLAPGLCQRLYAASLAADYAAAAACQQQLHALAALYARDRLLGHSYGLIKAMLGVWGLCGAEVLPPLRTPPVEVQAAARAEFQRWLSENAG
jgi:dihydrodipicolinate synthase/N-acetylneuraminate lyase